jgi:hypothetical protein
MSRSTTLRYNRTSTIDQSPSWKANSSSASQNFPAFYGNTAHGLSPPSAILMHVTLSYYFFTILLSIRTAATQSMSWTIPSRRKSFFSSSKLPEHFWDPPSLLSIGYHQFFPRDIAVQGFEDDHSPASSAEVKNKWTYNSTPLSGPITLLHSCVLVA